MQIVRERATDLTLDNREAELVKSLRRVLQFLELDESEIEVLEKRPTQINYKSGDNFHLPFDGDLTGANARLKILADVHVTGVAGQVSQVDGPVGVLR